MNALTPVLPAVGRRGFLVATSLVTGAFALAIRPGSASAADAAQGPWASGDANGGGINPWIAIAPDGTITIHSPKPESGNGTMTQMAMNVAEELECDWSKITVVTASMTRDWTEDHVYTQGFLPFFSGHATEMSRMQHCLQLGASARERLKAAAAARWGVDAGEIVAAHSLLSHAASGRTLSFGDVAGDAARIALPAEPALKPREDWKLIGRKSPAKLFIPEVVTGRAIFGIDVQLPGMVHAALRQVPVMGGSVKSVDARAVSSMPGVRKVVIIDPARTAGTSLKDRTSFGLGDSGAQWGIAVIADHYWQAKKALDALPVEWHLGGGANVADETAIYEAMRAAAGRGGGTVVAERGDVAAAAGKRRIAADYLTPYCENAVMEPLGGVARVTADSAELWCSTQDVAQAYWVAIDETGLPPEKVRINAAYCGGNFGRRTQAEDLRMVMAIARQYPGAPVKTIWSREECFAQGRYRTPVSTRFEAVLDDGTGLPQAVTGDCCFGGDRPLFHLNRGFADPAYYQTGAIPNVRMTTRTHPVHVLNGAYRAPCFNSHVFMTESFIDECAAAAGADPLEYRLRLLEGWDPSWSDALRLVAEKAGWGEALPQGDGLGLAIGAWPATKKGMGTVVACAAHVRVSPEGQLTVKRLDLAYDCGSTANRDAVHAQIEGAAIYALNYTLNEEMTLKDGAMVETNFDAYPMLRMADTPQIAVHDGALSGRPSFDIIGEAPVGAVGAAVGNAVCSATGKRLRSTPFRKHDLSWS